MRYEATFKDRSVTVTVKAAGKMFRVTQITVWTSGYQERSTRLVRTHTKAHTIGLYATSGVHK